MILIGVIIFTIITPKQASAKESVVKVKYWSTYASSLFCEWKCLNDPVRDKQGGYHTVQAEEISDDDNEAEDIMNSNLEENSENELNSTTEIRNMVT